jgi:hypothetical protein
MRRRRRDEDGGQPIVPMRKPTLGHGSIVTSSIREKAVHPTLQPTQQAHSRRGLLTAMTAAGLLGAGTARTAAPARVTSNDKRRSLYQAQAGEVQTFYRVNRYPAK